MKKVIFITGASSGIGRASAMALIREGHIVYGAARSIDRMDNIRAEGGHAIELDVANAEQVNAGIEAIMKAQGRIDVLVNNAGYGLYGAVEDIPIDEARRQFEVNLFGLASVTRATLPHMRVQKAGRIINVSSMGGKIYTPLGAWYHASKHAVEGWSDCLRIEIAPFNVDVVVIEPGLIATGFGHIVHDPMLRYSGEGPYGDLAKAIAKRTRETYEKRGGASSPSVVARAISRAVNAKKPKTRYVVGKMARPLLIARKWLPDRLFDKALMSQVP